MQHDDDSGDHLRCPVHGTVLSTPDRMIDGPCPQCEGEDDLAQYDEGEQPEYEPQPDDSMDGDHESALRDAGFGTDEDYGYFGGDEF